MSFLSKIFGTAQKEPTLEDGLKNVNTSNSISTMNEKINSTEAPEPVGAYPHARRVGNTLYLSGVGPRTRGKKEIPGVTLDPDGNIIAYDIEVQCRSVFKNVKSILDASGSSWDQLVDVTVFLTNMKADFQAYNKIYAEYFSDNQPCRTTVEIISLPTPIAIELKCVATIDSMTNPIPVVGKTVEHGVKEPMEESQKPKPTETKKQEEGTRSW
jgi:reactive intermediate/imine deaminase